MNGTINIDKQSGGIVAVLYGPMKAGDSPSVIIQLSDGFYFAMWPEQAEILGQQLLDAARKCAQ